LVIYTKSIHDARSEKHQTMHFVNTRAKGGLRVQLDTVQLFTSNFYHSIQRPIASHLYNVYIT